MTEKPIIFVTGATGKQGGEVVRSLLSKDFKVKALVRNPDSEKAGILTLSGAEVVQGDLDNPASYDKYLDGVYGVFSVQKFETGPRKEVQQGITLADAAFRHKVKHFVYSSVVGSNLNTGIPHWDSKYVIENHVKSLGLPYTILRPASFFENMLIPQVKSGILKGKYSIPLSNTVKQHMISVQDIGKAVSEVFSEPQLYLNHTYSVATEYLDSDEVSLLLSEVTGKKVVHQKLPWWITRIFLGKKVYSMFDWIEKHADLLAKNTEQNKLKIKNPVSLKEWARHNF